MAQKKGKNSPCFKDRTGEKYFTNEGYEVEVVECYRADKLIIMFICNGFRKQTSTSNLKRGNISNPYHRALYNIGFKGVGKFKTKENGKLTKIYRTWSNIFLRCYDEKERHKNLTYKDCIVGEHWHNFQNFGEWFEENYKLYMDRSWHLDKDLLKENNKIYSPETCCFIPQEINKLFKQSIKNPLKGIYKKGNIFIVSFNKKYRSYSSEIEAYNAYNRNKEEKIKNLAEKYKNRLRDDVYNRLINYKI